MLKAPSISFTVHFLLEPQAVARGMAWDVPVGWCNCSSMLRPGSCAIYSPGLGLLQDIMHSTRPRTVLPQPSILYRVSVLRDSQWKTTMCSSRLSPKVLWSQRRDVIDYSWLWVRPTHRKQNWYLSKPKRLFFFPAFDWFCHSLVIPYYFLLHKA